jgi:hypothetical protein
MKLSDAMMRKIQQEAESIPYGKITITLNDTDKQVAVNFERQERFAKETGADKTPVFKNGGMHDG